MYFDTDTPNTLVLAILITMVSQLDMRLLKDINLLCFSYTSIFRILLWILQNMMPFKTVSKYYVDFFLKGWKKMLGNGKKTRQRVSSNFQSIFFPISSPCGAYFLTLQDSIINIFIKSFRENTTKNATSFSFHDSKFLTGRTLPAICLNIREILL